MSKKISIFFTVCGLLYFFPSMGTCNGSDGVYTISTSYKSLLSNPKQTDVDLESGPAGSEDFADIPFEILK